MAEEGDTSDKTQDPTGKRLSEAHERGDVVKSNEVNTWFVIAGSTFLISSFSGSIASDVMVPMRNLLMHAAEIRVDGPGILSLVARLELLLLTALGIPLFLLLVAAVGSHLVQQAQVW